MFYVNFSIIPRVVRIVVESESVMKISSNIGDESQLKISSNNIEDESRLKESSNIEDESRLKKNRQILKTNHDEVCVC